MKSIWVNVAENDNQGRQNGYATVFQFGEIGTLWANDMKGNRFTHVQDKMRFRFSGKHYSYLNYQSWAGNIIYNAYCMHTIEACALLNEIVKSEKYHFEDVLSEVDDILESDGVLLLGDFERLMVAPA